RGRHYDFARRNRGLRCHGAGGILVNTRAVDLSLSADHPCSGGCTAGGVRWHGRRGRRVRGPDAPGGSGVADTGLRFLSPGVRAGAIRLRDPSVLTYWVAWVWFLSSLR